MLVLTLGCGSAIFAGAAPQALSVAKPAQDIDWDVAFADRSGPRPLHFVAQYQDARGSHRLEEWRTGVSHLRRRTDDRIDLHADAIAAPHAGMPTEYLWQIIDLPHRINNRISSQAMLRAGMFYSFYAMAHVLTRPAGRFHLTAVTSEPPVHLADASCAWYELAPEAQPATRICWSSGLAIPFKTESRHADGTWVAEFTLLSADRTAVPAAIYAVNPTGLKIRNHDEMATED